MSRLRQEQKCGCAAVLHSHITKLESYAKFGGSQESGRCGSATFPASGGELEVFYALITYCKYR